MTAEPTTLASWTRAPRKQLDALGLDSVALCRAAGLEPGLLADTSSFRRACKRWTAQAPTQYREGRDPP